MATTIRLSQLKMEIKGGYPLFGQIHHQNINMYSIHKAYFTNTKKTVGLSRIAHLIFIHITLNLFISLSFRKTANTIFFVIS